MHPFPSSAPLSPHQYHNRLSAAAEAVIAAVSLRFSSSSSSAPPQLTVAVVLGSGLSGFSSLLQSPLCLPYSSIPFLPQPAVSGHAGELVIGRLHETEGERREAGEAAGGSGLCLCFSGRVHSYEGHAPSSVCFISRLCCLLSVRCLLLTNSAGGAGTGMTEGSVMLITEHLRLCRLDALRDCATEARLGSAALDAASSPFLYSRELQAVARAAAASLSLPLHEGCYHWSCGPSYETPAEVRAGIAMGAAAFGMSTVPEALSAAALALPTVALSLCTNLAAGLLPGETLTHEAVKAAAQEAGPHFQLLVREIVRRCCSADVLPAAADRPPAAAQSPPPLLPPPPTLDLQPYAGWCPSPSEVASCVSLLLEANTGQPAPSLCVVVALEAVPDLSPASFCLPSPLAAVWDGLCSCRVLPLSDWPPLRARPLSRSSLSGFAVLGSLRQRPQSRVLMLSGLAAEGWTAAESALIAQVLAALGVRVLLQLALASACDGGAGQHKEDDTAAGLLVASELLDLSMDAPPPLLAAYRQPRAGAALFDTELSAVCVAALQAAVSDSLCAPGTSSPAAVRTGGVCCFGGPSLPSRSERSVAALSGCRAVSIAPAALSVAASALGLRCAAAFVVAQQQRSGALGVALPALVLALAEQLAAVDTDNSAAADLRASRAVSSAQSAAGRAAAPFSPMQEALTTMQAACSRLSSALPLSLPFLPACCIILHPAVLSSPPAAFVSLRSLPLSALLRDEQTAAATEQWTLNIAQYRGVTALLLSSSRSHSLDVGDDPLDCLRPAVRLLGLLGAASLLLCLPLTSLTAALPARSLCCVSDHINLTGHNPLFGHNIDSYGPRFPDCSAVYRTLQQLPPTVVACCHSPPALQLPCLRRLLLRLGASSLCQPGLLSLSLIARQMGISTAAIAWVAFQQQDEQEGREETATWLQQPHGDEQQDEQRKQRCEAAVLSWMDAVADAATAVPGS